MSHVKTFYSIFLNNFSVSLSFIPTACTFHSTSEFPLSDADAGKFVRIREDTQIGDVVFSIDAYPRSVEEDEQQPRIPTDRQ